jgi:hypothetical protein
MDQFLQQHAMSVTGAIGGWDRLRFRGTLRMLANVTGLSRFLGYTGRLFKDFGKYALEFSQQVRAASLAVAESAERPIVHLNDPSVSKEQMARDIAKRDGIKEGLIGVLTAVEPCWSYNIQSNRQTGHLDLTHQYRKCQHLYHYGLRNRDLQTLLFSKPTEDPIEKRRRSGQVTRKLRMLRAHGLIHKLPHTHRYMVSDKGRQVITALHAAREAHIEKLSKAA